MRILIIEDELPAARRLERMILKEEPDWRIVDVIDSIEGAVDFLQDDSRADLVFMDIQLADGYSFDIFERVNIDIPVIFATAYDEFAVKAFKVNGLDYLLKPIEKKELRRAIDKFKQANYAGNIDYSKLVDLLRDDKKQYKERFLVKKGNEMKFIETKNIAYFQADSGYVNLTTHQADHFLLDSTLDSLKDQLPPKQFFQISRQFIVNIDAISIISTWFNSRLKLKLRPLIEEDVVVSRERVKEFKKWLDS